MSSSVQESHSVLPLLMGRGSNISFVLDCSESMNGFLGEVKNLIVQTIISKASLRDSLFNIISFSYKATPWSSHMLPCTPDVVYEALGWIHTLQTHPGKDLLAAVALAFSDPACQSIHLVTCGLPDNPTQCLASLSTMVTRPVHTFYISQNPPLNQDVSDFLLCLTSTTCGSCYAIHINSAGLVKNLTLLHTSGNLLKKSTHTKEPWHPVFLNQVPTYNCTSCVCSVPYWCSPMNPFSSVSCVSARMMQGAELFLGSRVLAKREAEVFYYLGTIINKSSRNLYMVEFDKCGASFLETLNAFQPTWQPDMINLTIAHSHPIAPGDAVLAPWEREMRRYEPGKVLSGMELRNPLKGDEGNKGLEVLFWNGMRVHVPKDLSIWIPYSHYEQLFRELQHSINRTCGSMRAPHCKTITDFEFLHRSCIYHQQPSLPLCNCPLYRSPSLFMPPPLLNQQSKDELENIVDLQLKDLQTQGPSTSSSSTSDSDEDITDAKQLSSNLINRSINTDISCLRKANGQPERRPAWRYWKRGSAEPQHKQPGRAVNSPNVTKSWAGDTGETGRSVDASMMTNHSSLFKIVPNSTKRGINMRDLLKSAEPKSSTSPLIVAISKRSMVMIP